MAKPTGRYRSPIERGVNVAAIYVYDGKEFTLATLLASDFGDMHWHLFKNDFVPDEDTELGDIVEADFSGYGTVGSPFGAITQDAFGRAVSDADPVTFTHDGGGVNNTIYGYYTTTSDDVTLLFVERFLAPRLMNALGASIQLLPRVLDGNLAPP